MGDILNSKLFQDLKEGVLPEVKVGIDNFSLFKIFVLGALLFFTFFTIKKAFN